MARCLIIGCGCHGRELARSLRAASHAVRGTSRRPEWLQELAVDGVEPVLADPDRVVTLVPAFEHATVAYILLGSASGSAEAVAALHGTRLEMLLSKMLDTTIRGIVYQAAGAVDAAVLAGGADRVRATCEDSKIPFVLLRRDPASGPAWSGEALEALSLILAHQFDRTSPPASAQLHPR